MTEDDELALFRNAVDGVQPLKKASPRVVKPQQQSPGTVQRRKAAAADVGSLADGLCSEDYVSMVDPYEVLSFKRDGVQHGVFKNLRMGKYPVESRIDLHRMNVSQARQAFSQFLLDCVACEIRCALINHGKGVGRDKPALLKSCVNHWLREQSSVLAFHSAPAHQGGSGATCILFKKGDRKKNQNREQYGVRGSLSI